jgi:hypothetical protein
MGELEILSSEKIIKIHADIILYGDLATEDLTVQFCDEIETLWNEVEGSVEYDNDTYLVNFSIKPIFKPNLEVLEVSYNTNPRSNYFRVEDYSPLNISWVDGLNSNTGYMLIDNLYSGSTTGAHEFGHTMGLDHPKDLVYIGKGRPSIMYPRGTLVDPEFQYDPAKQPGEAGGTVHPMHRRVLQREIEFLNLPSLLANNQKMIGKFSSVYHPKHIKPAAV